MTTSSEESVEQSLRYRINVSITARGLRTWDCTVDGTGYTVEDVLERSDALVAALESRYPAQV